MPDVIITPSSGIIEFIPSSTTVNKIEASGNTFNLVNTANPSGTIFNIEATNGSLFSVVDNLDGTLMSVNNNAGLPVLEVFSDDRIVGGRFGQNDFVVNNNGNIGIGVSSPSNKVDISGSLKLRSSLNSVILNVDDVYGLNIDGNLNIDVGSFKISDPDFGDQFAVTSNGSINVGSWNASTIAVNKGGTGATTFTSGEVLVGNGTDAVYTLSRSGIDSRSTFPSSSHSITTHSATAWRMFFSNATTSAIQELGFGSAGTYLRSAGASANPTWATIAYSELSGAPTNIITGTGTSGYVSYWNSSSGQTGSSNFLWDNDNKQLQIGTASSSGTLYVHGSGYCNDLNVLGYLIPESVFGERIPGTIKTHKLIVNSYVASGPLDGPAGSIDLISAGGNKTITLTCEQYPINNSTFIFPDVSGSYTVVAKDTHGNFSAGTITATLNGNASTVTSGVYTTGNQSVGGIKTFTSPMISTAAGSVSTGGGQIYLNGSTGNRIDFNTNGVSDLSSIIPSAGTKIVLYPSIVLGSATNFAIGIGGDGLSGGGSPTRFWQSVNTTSSRFQWYAGDTNIATLTGSGVLTVAGSSSQINVDNLRLDGNTISSINANGDIFIMPNGDGNVGIGNTLPSSELDVNGTITAIQTNIGTTNILDSSATYGSIIGGYQSKASMYGEIAHSAGGFGNIQGTAQHKILIARGITLSGAFTVTIASPAVFTRNGHSLSVGDTVKLSTTGSLPTGLNTTTTYYVISSGLTGSTFQLSTTLNGTAVNTSGTQSGTHTLVPSTSLTLNGAIGLTTPQLMVIPARSTWSYTIKISAYNSQNNQGAAYHAFGGLRRNVSTTLELETTNGFTYLENSFDTTPSLVTINADTTNNALDIRVTGIVNQSTRWVAVVDITQVSFGTP